MSDEQPAEELPPETQAAIKRMKRWVDEPGTNLLGSAALPRIPGGLPYSPTSSDGKKSALSTRKQAPKAEQTLPKPATPVPPERQIKLQELAVLLAERIATEVPPMDGTQPFAPQSAERRQMVRTRAQTLLKELSDLPWHVWGPEEANLLLELVEHEVLEYGPLSPLLADRSVTEILVVGSSRVFVERAGKVDESPVRFQHETHLLRIIRALLRPLGRTEIPGSLIEEGRLPDGTWVQVIFPPCAVNGPILTIRKSSHKVWQMEDLIDHGMLSPSMASLLYGGVLAQLNIVIAGATGSGKTTLLNALGDFIPAYERIVTVEDVTELQLSQRQVVTLEAQPGQTNGTGRMTVSELIAQTLRLHPQRFLVGECRGEETFDLLQIMNAGQASIMTTIAATSPRDCLMRLETQAMVSGRDVLALRRQIASALHLIVYMARLRDGSCKVTHIMEVQGIDDQTILLQEVYRFRETGLNPATGQVQGVFESGGVKPRCYARLEQAGVRLPESFFVKEERRRIEPGDTMLPE